MNIPLVHADDIYRLKAAKHTASAAQMQVEEARELLTLQTTQANQKLMEACKPLEEYAWLVDSVRKNQKDKMDLELAVDMTIDKMQDSFMIKQFLVGNRAEVKQMFLTEYDQEKVMEQERKEIRIEVATDMLKKKFSLDDIIDISKLSKETILSIADSLGISVT